MGRYLREEQVTVSLTTKEREKLQQYAEETGLPTSTAFRHLALDQLNWVKNRSHIMRRKGKKREGP